MSGKTDSRTYNAETKDALKEIIENDDAVKLEALLVKYPDILTLHIDNDDQDTSIVFKAVMNNSKAVMKLCLDKGFDCIGQKITAFGGHAKVFHLAAEYRKYDVLKLLLEQHPEGLLQKHIFGGGNLLQRVCVKSECEDQGDLEEVTKVFELLLQDHGGKKIDINGRCTNQSTALHAAAMMNRITPVKLLLQQDGIDVNQDKNRGYTALHLASQDGYTSIVEMLLQAKGINPNVQDNNGNTPLHLAFRNEEQEVIKLLMGHGGVDANLRNKDGKLPKDYESILNE